MRRDLLYFKIDFNTGCDSFSEKGVDLSISGILQFSTVFKKMVFKSSAFLASFVKILSLSTSLTFSEDFILSEKKLK